MRANFLIGIALLGRGTDINEARSLTYANSIVDIYSNSWGPRDDGVTIDGPGYFTRSALQSGANEVCVQIFIEQNYVYRCTTFRVVMERVLFLYGLMAMEEMMMTALLMDIHKISTQSLLVLLEWMEHPAHLMNSARQKWLSHMLLIPMDIPLW